MDRRSFFAEVKRVGRPGNRGALLDLSVPRFGPWRWICNLYFQIVAPRLVAILTKRSVFAYRYLAESIEHHMDPREIVAELHAAGLTDAGHISLAGGIGAIFTWGDRKTTDGAQP
jgi:ubiquinone/menaquinone biosynthesis C-methylase UbiE